MGLVLSTKNLILKELLLMTKHEGLRATYHDYRTFEKRLKLLKKNSKFKRLNKLLDLGTKL